MVIDNSVKQGEIDWLLMRIGCVTASCFGDIVTGTTMKPSAGQRAYAYRLAAETITGEPLDGFESLSMFVGKANEGEARSAYQLLTGNTVTQVGMIFQDESRRIGASPDGLIFRPINDLEQLEVPMFPIGGVEIKNVNANTQVEYLYAGGVPAKYRLQIYGSLYVSGLDWWDFISCSPGLPPHLVRVNADDAEYRKYADVLDSELPRFLKLLDEIIKTVRNK